MTASGPTSDNGKLPVRASTHKKSVTRVSVRPDCRHYYSIAITYRKNELEEKMLMNLQKKTWTHGLTLRWGNSPHILAAFSVTSCRWQCICCSLIDACYGACLLPVQLARQGLSCKQLSEGNYAGSIKKPRHAANTFPVDLRLELLPVPMLASDRLCTCPKAMQACAE
jgi:hypothetical protein